MQAASARGGHVRATAGSVVSTLSTMVPTGRPLSHRDNLTCRKARSSGERSGAIIRVQVRCQTLRCRSLLLTPVARATREC
eukprot:796580-Pyramimonas_sp.AAC.1